MRQDRQNGGWIQEPVDHMNDPVGRHDVGGRQADALLAQQDVTLDGGERQRTQHVQSLETLKIPMNALTSSDTVTETI